MTENQRMRRIAFALAITAAACTRTKVQQAPSPSPTTPARSLPPSPSTGPTTTGATATANINDASGARLGTVTLTDTYSGVLVVGSVSGVGLGAHGIHIHEIGKCEAPFTSAGGHFNPQHRQHGYRNPNGPHLGDMPNLESPAAGVYRFEFLVPGVTLTGNNALLDGDGAAIVIHAARDDYTTDPSGNSGGRIGCGVITAR